MAIDAFFLYQSKNCGHRIHVLFMMYDVYCYCQMKKNEWLWKFEKTGVVEKRGKEETKSMPHAHVANFTKTNFVAEFPCQHSHTIFRKDVWRHINWFALFRVTWYDFQEVKWILVSLSDMQQKRDNSNENTWKLNETYSISNKFTYWQFFELWTSHERKKANKFIRFCDDLGAWDTSKGTSVKSYYVLSQDFRCVYKENGENCTHCVQTDPTTNVWNEMYWRNDWWIKMTRIVTLCF